MRSRPAGPRTFAAAILVFVLTALWPVEAIAQGNPFADTLTLVPEQDSAPSGTCNEFTARVTEFDESPQGPPLAGVMVDVRQTLTGATTEPDEDRELSFCDPLNPAGPNPTGQGGTAFGNVTGNNPGQTAGDAGRNTTVQGEVGPTNANGEVTFGIAITPGETGTVSVFAWFDSFSDDDEPGVEGDPSDTGTKTWTPGGPTPVTTLDATPETSTGANGTQHTVSVAVTNNGNPVPGFVPSSLVASDATGRPAGDAADPNAGASPNLSPGPNAYTCSPSNAGGVSTCTFGDPAGTGPGTDTVVFFDDRFGAVAGVPEPNEPQDAVQMTWFQPQGPGQGTGSEQPPSPEPRNIRLCHGTETGAACDTSVVDREPSEEHQVSALVTDQNGAALANVPVELRETGPAEFVAGGNSTLLSTGPDGIVRAVVTSETTGTSSLVAEISPPNTLGSSRGPGPSDDECEQPAGTNGTPPAGNCVSAPLTVTWSTAQEPAECEDTVDNDGDDLVDYPDDPGCADAGDDSEVDPDPEPETVRHSRRTNMRFRDWVGPGDEGLVIFGRLRLADEDDEFVECAHRQPMLIQRRVDGEWKTLKHAKTNATGRWTGVVFDVPGPYRAVAPRVELEVDGVRHVCFSAHRVKTHHHRR